MSGQHELTLSMKNSSFFRTYILLVVSIFTVPSLFAATEESYEAIVSDLENSTDTPVPSVNSMPVGGYFSMSTGTFSNAFYELQGNRYTPELGLYVPGKLRIYAYSSLLSGTRSNVASQEFTNYGLGFDMRLMNVSRSPQMDLWLNSSVRLAGDGSSESLGSPADSYRVGGTFVSGKRSLRSQMGAAYEFRSNEQILGLDLGDRSDFHFDLSFETFRGVYLGGEANWYVVMPLKVDGKSQTPTVSWITVGPRVEVNLFSGLDLNLLLLYPVQRSHDVEVIEQAVADIYSPRLNEATFNLSLEAGI